MTATNIIDNVNKALDLLKDGQILLSITKNNLKTYFAMKQNKIFVQNNYSCYSITLLEFKSLFNDCKFIIYEIPNSSFVDLKKDEEYYGWDVLKK